MKLKKSFKINVLSFIGVVVGLASSGAHAVVLMNCPASTPAPFSRIYVSSFAPETKATNRPAPRALSCNDVGEMTTVIRGVNQIFQGLIKPPASMELNFLPMEDNAFSAGHAFLHLPREIIINDLAKNPSFTQAVWAHEYGHTLLLNAFMQRDSSFLPLADILDRSAQLMMNMTIIREEFTKLTIQFEVARKAGDEKAMTAIANQLKAIVEQGQKLNAEGKKMQSGMDVNTFQALSPYNEFFADLVALIYTGHPDSVAQSLFRTGTWQQMQKTRPGIAQKCLSCRDFSARENSIDQWIRLRKMGKELPSEAHNVLAPARYYVWSQYFKAGSVHQFPAQAASKVLDVIRVLVKKRAADARLNLPQPDPIAMNLEFMDALDRALAR